MKFCEIIIIIIIIKYTFMVLVLRFSCPKKEEATRDRVKLSMQSLMFSPNIPVTKRMRLRGKGRV